MPHLVAKFNTTNERLPQIRRPGRVCDMPVDSFQFEEIGARLRRLREQSGLNQTAWADKHGFNRTQYNNWERGDRRIPLEHAEALCDAYGLTLDFIYRGRLDGLSEYARKAF